MVEAMPPRPPVADLAAKIKSRERLYRSARLLFQTGQFFAKLPEPVRKRSD
jgi:hypothetical protein